MAAICDRISDNISFLPEHPTTPLASDEIAALTNQFELMHIRTVQDRQRDVCRINATNASRIIPTYGKLCHLQITHFLANNAKAHVRALKENRLYLAAQSFYTSTTQKIVAIVSSSKIDEAKLQRLERKEIIPRKSEFSRHPEAQKVYDRAVAVLLDAKGYIRRTPPSRFNFFGCNRQTSDLPIEQISSLQSNLEKLVQLLSTQANYTDLTGTIGTHQRTIDEIKVEIQAYRPPLDNAKNLLVNREGLFQQQEKLDACQKLLDFIKTFDCKETHTIFSAQSVIGAFFEYLEGYSKSASKKTAADNFQLALRGFRACNTLLEIVSIKSDNPFLNERIQFLKQAVSNHAAQVFALSECEKQIPHQLLVNKTVPTDEIRAYVTKRAAQYLFCKKPKELPDFEVELVLHIAKDQMLEIEDEILQHYFSRISKIKDVDQLDKCIHVLRCIHIKLLTTDRDPLAFLESWHHYFELTTQGASCEFMLTYIANTLNRIAEEKGYFHIDLFELNTHRSGLSRPAFVKALGEAIWETDEKKLRDANDFLKMCMQIPDFKEQIEPFKQDAHLLLSLNLKRKLDQGKIEDIFIEESQSALENGFLKDLLNSEGSRVLEQDLLDVARLLYFIENVDPEQDLALQVSDKRPVLKAMLDAYGQARMKQWYKKYCAIFAPIGSQRAIGPK